MSKSPDHPTVSLALCGLAQAADLLGDRWTLLILREAFYGVRRFEELRENIGASRQALSGRLNVMVQQELLTKRAYREPGERERYEYVLTSKGRSLGPILVALMAWGHQHILHDTPHVQLVNKHSGLPVQLALMDTQGNVVPEESLQISAVGESPA
ncbi:helix-turn-helix domain-containing protein [Serratia sp. FDAARGOS_506]|uniref:winged helix-turn-helix transcriptional regulator n=1 Tax=Serratia sp. FDAARGOS_506 TaxID=2420306 RepID=UPI000F50AD72|nr:helix-turn-helix domain-containing protein [Serratia sp. FDAARGOS_506]AYZ32221.1 transcriptional regulator [Serratia sp. FDAARGOS_506]